jgi:hypothetical protein
MLGFFQSKPERQYKAKESLEEKLIDMISTLGWARRGFEIERIVEFYNVVHDFIKTLSKDELEVAPQLLQAIVSDAQLGVNGWYHSEEGERADTFNTYIKPPDELLDSFHVYSIDHLLKLKDEPTLQGGFADKPMTRKEFYAQTFVEPFALKHFKALEISLRELRQYQS